MTRLDQRIPFFIVSAARAIGEVVSTRDALSHPMSGGAICGERIYANFCKGYVVHFEKA